MPTTRRTFITSSAAAAGAAPLAAGAIASAPLDSTALARKHAIVRQQATPDFFEGMVMGNGDIGVMVTVRPDALGLHLGKLDVWDIRVSEEHERDVKPFAQVLEMVKEAADTAKREGDPQRKYLESQPPLAEYTKAVQRSYRKPWPRPWPCGIVWLHWDSRSVRVVKQSLDISNAVLTVTLEHDDLRGKKRPLVLTVFVSRDNGHISVSSDGPAPIASISYSPHRDPNAKMPDPLVECEGHTFFCRQVLPATAPPEGSNESPASKDDRTFALAGLASGSWTPDLTAATTRRGAAPVMQASSGAWSSTGGRVPSLRRAFLRAGASPQPLRLDLTLFTTRDRADAEAHARAEAQRTASIPVAQLRVESEKHWAEFWSKSAVSFNDAELERIWYHNQYFLACCLKPGVVAPGLFGNWSSGNIGTAWHGDYHMNYNTQQVWWGVFSSNHIEQHEPYVRLVEQLAPMAEWNARVQFSLPGLYFPHSAYPVPSKVNPYPAPPWGYEICETPWTVQSLWWEYLYTMDTAYLKRVYPLLRGATDFLVAFLRKESDGRYHVVPTVSPENWGFTVDFRLNKNCIIDIALIDFLLEAMVEASATLGIDADLRGKWEEVRRSLAPYPTVDGPYGKVWLDIENAPPEWVYNVPVTLSPVFPAERVGLGLNEEQLEIAKRTTATIRLEGGNDLVWQPLARARLAMLDLDWFKQEVGYCLIPNGVANDRCRQIDGRYRDETNFDFMMRMGVWTENLSLPAVLNECLMQSYTGVIRLFPNTKNLGPARFHKLRAARAFLVSAAWDGKAVASGVKLVSEKGAKARVAAPWAKVAVEELPEKKRVETTVSKGVVEFSTVAGKEYVLRRA
jgi:alpha-L-fucosidase 2